MRKFSKSAGTVMATFIALTWAAPSQAQTVRAWVSGHGSDIASCGAPATPCRTLQYTHDNIVAAGGEIDILDPAGYGTITITKSISIVNDGVGTAGVQSNSGNAITINAPGASVYLRGLNIDGVQNAGVNGIEFDAGSSLTVVNCVVRHFNRNGILIDPMTGTISVAISDSAFLENNNVGIEYQPTASNANGVGIIDRVRAQKNASGGILVNSANDTGSARFTISNSDASNNGTYGIASQGFANNNFIEVNSSTMESNAMAGLSVYEFSTAHVAKSVIDFNGQHGIENFAAAPAGVFSGGDNHVEGNGASPVFGSTLAPETLY